jgi:ribose transport system ATP-binding protein
MTGPQPALQVRGLAKRFGAIEALRGVDLDVAAGEVHGLLGANGSGKSTLIKILAGYHAPDAGSISVGGSPVSLPVTTTHGLAIIHQELGLVEGMTVLENLGVNVGYGTRSLLPVRGRAERRVYREIFDSLGVELDLDQKVGSLTPAERALLAVARAMRVISGGQARQLFVLDEPTTYLPRPEANRVTALMRSVAKLGIGVLFVSHRLKEVLATTDTFTVLRDGQVVANGVTARTSEREIIRAILGRDLAGSYPDKIERPDQKDPVLEVQDLSGPRVQQVTFSGYAGEVLGITGLSGMGQDELSYIIAGALPRSGGRVLLNGTDITGRGPRDIIGRGAVLIPSDRQRHGGWLAGTAQENISLPVIGDFFRRGLLRSRRERDHSLELMNRFDVRPPVPENMMRSFSGGNQQKIVLSKWLQLQPKVVLLDEPTQGVDAGARTQILQTVTELARQGSCVIVFSGDHEQLAAICHRVLVMSQGSISAELTDDQVTEDWLLSASQLGTSARTSLLGP